MKKPLKRLSALTLLALFALSGCGTDDVNQFQGNIGLNGFMLVSSDPWYATQFVPLSSQITVRFNEAVDTSSTTGNISFTETAGSGPQDITSQISFSFGDGNTLMIFSLSRAMIFDATYKLTFLTGLRSVTGRNLSSIYDVIFFTGAGDLLGIGANSQPGPPTVLSMTRQITATGWGPTLSFLVTFNEDLIYAPIVEVKREPLWGWLGGGVTYQTETYPVYANRYDIYEVYVGTGCSFFPVDYETTIKVLDAVDLEGERITSNPEQTFGTPFFVPGC